MDDEVDPDDDALENAPSASRGGCCELGLEVDMMLNSWLPRLETLALARLMIDLGGCGCSACLRAVRMMLFDMWGAYQNRLSEHGSEWVSE